MLSDWRWGLGWWTPPINALFTSLAAAALNCPRPVIMSEICGSARAAGALGQPPRGHLLLPTSFFCRTHFISPWTQGGPPSTSSTSVVAAAGPADSNPQGPAIDVSNFVGGRCRTCRQHPPGGPPSTSSTLVVVAAGPAASTPQGARHRRLQLQWWLLPDLPQAPPKGPAIDVSNSGGGRY
jgi:hypothetical protein